MFEDHNFYYEFRVKVLQTFSGVICGQFLGNMSVFSLENAILSSYSSSDFTYYILLVQGSAIGIFYKVFCV